MKRKVFLACVAACVTGVSALMVACELKPPASPRVDVPENRASLWPVANAPRPAWDAQPPAVIYNVEVRLVHSRLLTQIGLPWDETHVLADPNSSPRIQPPSALPINRAAMITGAARSNLQSLIRQDIQSEVLAATVISTSDDQPVTMTISGVSPPLTLTLWPQASDDLQLANTAFVLSPAEKPSKDQARQAVTPTSGKGVFSLPATAELLIAGGLYTHPAHSQFPARQLILTLKPEIRPAGPLIPLTASQRSQKTEALLSDARSLSSRQQYQQAAGLLRVASVIEPGRADLQQMLDAALAGTGGLLSPLHNAGLSVRRPSTLFNNGIPANSVTLLREMVRNAPASDSLALLLREQALEERQQHIPNSRPVPRSPDGLLAPIQFEITPLLVDSPQVPGISRQKTLTVRTVDPAESALGVNIGQYLTIAPGETSSSGSALSYLLQSRNAQPLPSVRISLKDNEFASTAVTAVSPAVMLGLKAQLSDNRLYAVTRFSVWLDPDQRGATPPLQEIETRGTALVRTAEEATAHTFSIPDQKAMLITAGKYINPGQPGAQPRWLMLHVRALLPVEAGFPDEHVHVRQDQIAQLMVRARERMAAKSYDAAAQILQQLLTIDPQHVEAKSLLAAATHGRFGGGTQLLVDECELLIPPSVLNRATLTLPHEISLAPWPRYLSVRDGGNPPDPAAGFLNGGVLEERDILTLFSPQSVQELIYFSEVRTTTIDPGVGAVLPGGRGIDGPFLISVALDEDRSRVALRLGMLDRDPSFSRDKPDLNPEEILADKHAITVPLNQVIGVRMPGSVFVGGWPGGFAGQGGITLRLLRLRLPDAEPASLPDIQRDMLEALLAENRKHQALHRGLPHVATTDAAFWVSATDPEVARARAAIEETKVNDPGLFIQQRTLDRHLDEQLSSFDVDRMPLEQALRQLIDPSIDPLAQTGSSTQFGGGNAVTTAIMPWYDLQYAGVDGNTPVTLHVKDMTRGEILSRILAGITPRDNPGDFETTGGRLRFGPLYPQQDTRGRLRSSSDMYGIQRQLASQVEKQIPELAVHDMPLGEFIQLLRRPESAIHVDWEALSGAGVERDTPVSLVLKKVSVHEAVQAALAQIRATRGVSLAGTPFLGAYRISTPAEMAAIDRAANRRIARAMDSTISFFVAADQRVEDVIQIAREAYGIPITLETHLLSKVGFSSNVKLKFELGGPTLRQIVQKICDELTKSLKSPVTFRVQGGLIIIESQNPS